MNNRLNKKRALEEIQKRFKKAEDLLKDDVRMESFLEKIEKKIKWIPFLAQEFKNIPTMVSMVRSYLRGNYTKIPKRTILAIVSALIYFLSPIDLVPDWIPLLGQLDDAIVIATCWNLVNKDVEDYRQWKKESRLQTKETN